jgi:predicted membrane protein
MKILLGIFTFVFGLYSTFYIFLKITYFSDDVNTDSYYHTKLMSLTLGTIILLILYALS